MLYLDLDDNVPWVEDLAPAYGLFDASSSNSFSWTFRAEAGISSTPKQKSCLLQWRAGKDGVWGDIHEIEGGADSRLSIPADVMPVLKDIQWRVKVTGSNDVESEWSNWITLSPLSRTPIVTVPAPQAGYLNDSRPNEFSWALGTAGTKPGRMPKQMAFRYEWRDDTTGVISAIEGGAAGSVTIPADTFPFQARFSWRVQVQSDDGLWSEFTPWYQLTTVRMTGTTAAISPDGQNIAGGAPIIFVWEHASRAGLPQAAWELQYRADPAQDWSTFASGEDSRQQHTVDDYDFQPGAMYWRVRTRDAGGDWGDWSNVLENYLVTQPDTPVLNEVPNETRPLVSWQTDEQLVYQLQIMDMDGNVLYDSGEVSTESRQHQVTDFLSSGEYIFAVRIQSEFNVWSEWGERVAVISLADIGVPRIECAAIFGGVRVRISAPIADAYHILYRDESDGYIPIARLDAGQVWYDDYTCVGKPCRYYARAVKSGSYGDSRALTDAPDIRYTLVALADNPGDMVAVWYRKGSPPDRRETSRVEVSLRHFQGRRLPVAEYGEGVDRERSFTFSIAWIKSPDDVRRLRDMTEAARPFLIRDQYGRKLFAALPSFQVGIDRHSGDFTLTFNEVDYTEAISDA